MSEWEEFKIEFVRRFHSPRGSMGFVIYFVFALIVVGGAGIWYNVYKAIAIPACESCESNWFGVSESICFFSITVGCASFAESLLRLIKKIDILERNFDISMFALFFIGLFLSLFGIINAASSNMISFLFSVVAWPISLLLWWLVGSTNPNLNSCLNVDKILNPNTDYMDNQSGNAGLQL